MKPFNHLLDLQQETIKPIFISSYIPRKCGIATFCKDLTKAINDLNPEGLVEIVAIDEAVTSREYPEEVKARILRNDYATYEEAAAYINASDADIVCLQHEYGLYGTDFPEQRYGEYILPMLRLINKPIVTTLHTIMEHPSEGHREVLREVADLSDIMIAMLSNAKERLEQNYGISSERIVVVNHGVADRPRAHRLGKPKFGWQDHKVLLMTGLLSPGKGVEYVIKALPQIVQHFPNALFVLAGETHPEILERDGEKYRDSLTKLAEDLGVAEHLHYENRYMPLDELLEYYEACDIYLTPHLDPQQVASGTLAYALGMGKACISTKYIYAREMLSEGRGMLVDFENSDQIAEAALQIFGNPLLQEEMERKAYGIGRTMSWPRVAERYLNLLRLVRRVHYDALATTLLQPPRVLERLGK